jgi:hypothetical protein
LAFIYILSPPHHTRRSIYNVIANKKCRYDAICPIALISHDEHMSSDNTILFLIIKIPSNIIYTAPKNISVLNRIQERGAWVAHTKGPINQPMHVVSVLCTSLERKCPNLDRKLRKMVYAAERRLMQKPLLKTRCMPARSLDQNDGSDCPEQSGILTPGLMLRSMSMMPHLSSHSLPFSL